MESKTGGSDGMDPLFFHMPLDTKIEIATTRDTGYALVKAIEHENELNGNNYNLGGGSKYRVIYRNLLKHSFSRRRININHFPENSFAKKNFHCGYYQDSNCLEEILHFQRDDLEAYYQWIDKDVSFIKRLMGKLFSKMIVKKIAKKSEPLQALKNGDTALIHRFYAKK